MATNEEAKPHPMVKPPIPKVLMGRGGYLSNEERIKKDEAELEEMKKQARAAAGITDEESSEDQNTSPPKPEDFAKWFETNNSVDLRALLRDIEIVFIEAALDRNSGNTSEAAKDLKLLRTTLIEKVKKYSL